MTRIFATLIAAMLFTTSRDAGAQGLADTTGSRAMTLPPKTAGACAERQQSGATPESKPLRVVAFHVAAGFRDRTIQLVRDPTRGTTGYVELVVENDPAVGPSVYALVGTVDSSGRLTGFSQRGHATPEREKPPTISTMPLDSTEKRQIPFLIEWIKNRCGNVIEYH